MVRLRGLLRRFLSCFVVAVLMFLVCVASARVFAVDVADEARMKIEGAELRVVVCYEVVVQAESAGGNVSELAGVLNEAGVLLSQARAAFERGEFDLAVEFSSNCTARLVGFTEKGLALRDSAVRERDLDFWVNIFGSVVGTEAVVVAGWALWVFSRRKRRVDGSAV